MHSVDAPVASFVTVSSVPNGSVGLAQYPDGASEYQVAWPVSRSRGGAVVVVVGGGAVVVVTTCGAKVVVVVGGAGAVVVVVGGAVVVVVGAWYATRFDGNFTPPGPDGVFSAPPWGVWARGSAAEAACDAVAVALCNSRRGAPKSVPQMTAATPRRLPPVLWFRRAPPFSGDTVHPRRHTGGEGFLENLDNQSRLEQTSEVAHPRSLPFSQVRTAHDGGIWVNTLVKGDFDPESPTKTQVTRFSYYAQKRVD